MHTAATVIMKQHDGWQRTNTNPSFLHSCCQWGMQWHNDVFITCNYNKGTPTR